MLNFRQGHDVYIAFPLGNNLLLNVVNNFLQLSVIDNFYR